MADDIDTRIIMQVHDELVLQMMTGQLDEIREKVYLLTRVLGIIGKNRIYWNYPKTVPWNVRGQLGNKNYV